jgi:ribosomal protein L9
VTNREIAELLRQQGIDIDRHAIHLREPIKTLGEHRASVHLGAGLDATLVIEVAPLVEGQAVTTA